MTPVSLFVAGSLLLAAWAVTPQPTPQLDDDAPAVAVDQPAPGFELPDENEENHTLASLHDGKYVVLSFSRAHW